MIYRLHNNDRIDGLPMIHSITELNEERILTEMGEYYMSRLTENGWLRVFKETYDIYYLNIDICIKKGYNDVNKGGFISICLKHIKKYIREEKLKRVLCLD